MCEPMYPAPPVTRTLIGAARYRLTLIAFLREPFEVLLSTGLVAFGARLDWGFQE